MSDTFVLDTPPRANQLCLSSRSNRRSTTIMQFQRHNDSPKSLSAFDSGKVSGSLADIQQFHASFNRNYQAKSIEEEDDLKNDPYFKSSILCRQKGPPMLCTKSSFVSMSSSSSLESNDPPVETFKQPAVERKHAVVIESLPNQRIPNFKLHPASPSVERVALRWTTDQPKLYRKMSDVSYLSTEDESCYAGGRRHSLSKSPTRVLDQILLKKLNSSTQTEQPTIETTNQTVSGKQSTDQLNADLSASLEWAKTNLTKWPSFRTKKSKSLKSESSPLILNRSHGKRHSNTLLFDSGEQKNSQEG